MTQTLWSATRTLLALFAFFVLPTGCLETGLGEPETAKIDPRLKGVWATPNADEYILVKPWDGRTYLVSTVKAQSDSGGYTRYIVGQGYKAWLATVDDATYISIDMGISAAKDLKLPYGVARLTIQEDQIVTEGLNIDFVREAKTSADLAKIIRENRTDPKLYPGKVVYTRASAEVVKAIARG